MLAWDDHAARGEENVLVDEIQHVLLEEGPSVFIRSVNSPNRRLYLVEQVPGFPNKVSSLRAQDGSIGTRGDENTAATTEMKGATTPITTSPQ